MPEFWVTSEDIEFDVRLEAEDLAAASDVVGRFINDGAVVGFVRSDELHERTVIINWRQLASAVVSSEPDPDSPKAFVGGVASELSLRHGIADWQERALRGERWDPAEAED